MEYFYDINMFIKEKSAIKNVCLRNWENPESSQAHTR